MLKTFPSFGGCTRILIDKTHGYSIHRGEAGLGVCGTGHLNIYV